MASYVDNLDINVTSRPRPHSPVQYIERVRERDYGVDYVPRAVRARERREDGAAGPVVIQNRVYSDTPPAIYDDYQVVHKSTVPHQTHATTTQVRGPVLDGPTARHYDMELRKEPIMTREEWERVQAKQELERQRRDMTQQKEEKAKIGMNELQNVRKELEGMKLAKSKEMEAMNQNKTKNMEQEVNRMRRELAEIQEKRAKDEAEQRIRDQVELERLREEAREEKERRAREKEVEDALIKLKLREKEMQEREFDDHKKTEKEVQILLQDRLLHSGLDERAINKILRDEKVNEARQELVVRQEIAAPAVAPAIVPSVPLHSAYAAPYTVPTYTKISRQYATPMLLRHHNLEFDDSDPHFYYVKGTVPDATLRDIWTEAEEYHHRVYRHDDRYNHRTSRYEEKPRHHVYRYEEKPRTVQLVRRKDRSRSKLPTFILYMAGALP